MFGDDTSMGGREDRFPATQHSVVLALGSDSHEERSRAFHRLVEAYWKPVYKYIRLEGRKDNETAKDLTQDFFTSVLEKNSLDRFDPARAKLRTFMRVCIDRFVGKQDAAAARLKRGGDRTILSLDFDAAEDELKQTPLPSAQSIDVYFENEWARSVFALSVEKLQDFCKARGKEVHFSLFERYDLGGADAAPTYASLAEHFGISVESVTNYLASMRREFRRLVLDTVRELTATDEEFRSEARSLLGIDVR